MALYSNVWEDYELIDAGNFKKLERFGDVFLIRPEQQALWEPRMKNSEWEKVCHAEFISTSKKSGEWKKMKKVPNTWAINYNEKGKKLFDLQLELTKFKHIGVFPEQSANWSYIYESVKLFKEKPKILNLFAYTGASSLAAKSAGAEVTHVDSIRQVINWANINMKISKLDNIRWIVEDALKYVSREEKRGNIYQGIIMDPPTFGYGPKGEKWHLDQKINELIRSSLNILDKKRHFFILNTYSTGFSSIVLKNILNNYQKTDNLECGDLVTRAKSGISLPHGYIARFRKN